MKKVSNKKRKTLVKNIITGEEIAFKSRFEAANYVGMERKRINAYIDRGIVFDKKYRFLNI